jgi:hypothetical protein
MRIDSSGNVGIGTSSTIAGTRLIVKDGYTAFQFNSGATYPTYNSYFGAIGTNFQSGFSYLDFWNNAGSGFQWHIQTGASTQTSVMTIDSSGNVGIGTSSPSSKLDVSGVVSLQGTTLPSAGTARLYSRSSDSSFYMQPATGGSIILLDGLQNSMALFGSSLIQFLTGNTERMRIDSSGNVGIGTSSPSTKLQISAATPVVTVTSTGTTASSQDFTTNSAAQRTTIGTEQSAGGGLFVGSSAYAAVFGSAGASNTQFATNNNVRATIDTSGNVGIGTSSPSYKLHVRGTDATAVLVVGNTSEGTQLEVLTYQDDKVVLRSNDTSNVARTLAFETGTTEAARIDSNGNLLVGTTSQFQTSRLSVSGTGNVGDFRTSSASGYPVVCENSATGSTNMVIFLSGASFTTVGSITYNGSLTLYNTTSDQRLKENIQDAESASSLIDSLKVRKFDWKESNIHQRYGFVAQELVTVAPEAVHQPTDPDEMMAVDYSKLVPMLVKEIQSLRQRVAQLESN